MLDRSEQLAHLRKFTWEVVDQDEALEMDMRALYFLFWHILMTGPNQETYVTGLTIRQQGMNTMLVLKAVIQGTPQVAFISAKFPIDCVRVAGRLWLDNGLKWHNDRFA